MREETIKKDFYGDVARLSTKRDKKRERERVKSEKKRVKTVVLFLASSFLSIALKKVDSYLLFRFVK